MTETYFILTDYLRQALRKRVKMGIQSLHFLFGMTDPALIQLQVGEKLKFTNSQTCGAKGNTT